MRRRTALICLLATPAWGDGVLSTYIGHVGTAPELTVVQEENQFGQSSYTRILEDEMTLQVEVYGGCNANWRVQAAAVSTCPNVVEVCPAGPDSSPNFRQVLSVNQSARSFGPRLETITVPTSFVEDYLTSAGNELIALLASLTEGTAAEWRRIDLSDTLDWSLSFVFQCRRWFGNNDVEGESSSTLIPIDVTFRGTETGDADLPFGLEPILPGAPETPIPFDALSAGPRITGAALSILADPLGDPCRLRLSASLAASAATEIVYHLEDARGARSPDYRLGSDAGGGTVATHDLSFAEDRTTPEGFTRPADLPEPAAGEAAFAGGPVRVPPDPLKGFFRLVTTVPHRAQSNLVAYDLDRCTGQSWAEAPGQKATVALRAEGLIRAFGPGHAAESGTAEGAPE